MTRALLLCLALLPAAAPADEPRLPELEMVYATTWNGISLGDLVVTLQPHGEPDCYRYESLTEPVGLVRMFYGKPRDVSEFCVRDGRVVPRRFSFIHPKYQRQSFTLEFDMADGKVRGPEDQLREVPPNAQDRFGLQQAVRLWVIGRLDREDPGQVAFTMVDDERVKTYRFAITGRQAIEIPAGRFETVLVQRIDDPKKTSKFWLARERDYMPVKVEQIKGDTDLRMVLKK